MTYKALDIAKKLIFKAQNDEPNGGERLTNLKLQKLLYYQQGYHLAAFGTPLFSENIVVKYLSLKNSILKNSMFFN